MMNETGRGDGQQLARRFLGLRLGGWLVLALWVLPHPALAQSATAFNQGVAYTISGFYAAAFDRTPVPNSTLPDYGDLGGLAFWTEAYLTGAGGLAPYRENVYAIADFFVTSDEFQARYPASLTNAAFITAVVFSMWT